MLIPQALNKSEVQNSVSPRCSDILAELLLQGIRTAAGGIEVRIEKSLVPLPKRRVEATLGSIARFGREEFAEGIDRYASRFAIPNLVGKRGVEAHLYECRIEERYANFQSGSHAHAIGIVKNVVDEKGIQIHFQNTIVLLRQRTLRIRLAQDFNRGAELVARGRIR